MTVAQAIYAEWLSRKSRITGENTYAEEQPKRSRKWNHAVDLV